MYYYFLKKYFTPFILYMSLKNPVKTGIKYGNYLLSAFCVTSKKKKIKRAGGGGGALI